MDRSFIHYNGKGVVIEVRENENLGADEYYARLRIRWRRGIPAFPNQQHGIWYIVEEMAHSVEVQAATMTHGLDLAIIVKYWL